MTDTQMTTTISKAKTVGQLKEIIKDFDDDLLISFHDKEYEHEFNEGVEFIEAVGIYCVFEIS